MPVVPKIGNQEELSCKSSKSCTTLVLGGMSLDLIILSIQEKSERHDTEEWQYGTNLFDFVV